MKRKLERKGFERKREIVVMILHLTFYTLESFRDKGRIIIKGIQFLSY